MSENNNKISTVKKGDDFESRSLGIIQRLIHDSQISHLPEHIKVYTRKDKGYYSSLREKKIFFDITIEIWPPNAKRSSFTYFIECKNYGHPVPVGQVSKFAEDVREVAGLNCKAIFITNTRLQEGGYNIAKNIGMMLIQGESKDDFQIILNKSSLPNFKDPIPILQSTLLSSVIDRDTVPLEKLVDDIIRSAFIELEEESLVSYSIDRLSRNDIITRAENELKKFNSLMFKSALAVNIDELKEYLLDKYDIKIKKFSSPIELLGNCDFKNNSIGLNQSIINTKRELFVLGHELGHYFLHHSLKIGRVTYQNFEDSKKNFKTGKRDLNNPKNWIEWQANQFSSSFILPRTVFLARLWRFQDISGVSRGKIYVDDQKTNQKMFLYFVGQLSTFFNVSKTSIIYKLNEMELITNNSNIKTIGQIFDEYSDEFDF
jgi:Zn-dependent peptidase ImmA (M78 family)